MLDELCTDVPFSKKLYCASPDGLMVKVTLSPAQIVLSASDDVTVITGVWFTTVTIAALVSEHEALKPITVTLLPAVSAVVVKVFCGPCCNIVVPFKKV